MSCPPRVTAWTRIIQTHVPHWSTPHATVLAVGSLGMARARSGALTAVSAFLATWLGRKEPAVRQQWREFCDAATATRGTPRRARAVEPCFTPLLAWVVAQWERTQLAVAAHPHDAARPGGPPVAGRGRGDLVAVERWG